MNDDTMKAQLLCVADSNNRIRAVRSNTFTGN